MRSLGRPFAPQRLREMFGQELDYVKVRQRRKELMEACIDKEGIQAKAGAVELLTALRSQGLITAVATATDLERTHKYLEMAGLQGYFEELISATQVAEGKPSPDIYRYACERLGLAPEECLAVEDSPNGVLAAYRAGCKVVMVPDQTEPDEELCTYLYACVASLVDIKGIVDGDMTE